MLDAAELIHAPYADENKWRHIVINIFGRLIWRISEYAALAFSVVGAICLQKYWVDGNHTDRFVYYMDVQLPQWRLVRDELKAEPLSHEEWET